MRRRPSTHCRLFSLQHIVVGFLGFRRRWHEAALPPLARCSWRSLCSCRLRSSWSRPRRTTVVRLNSTPSTSSFPSGHTAARDRALYRDRNHCVLLHHSDLGGGQRAAGRRCHVDRGLCSRVSGAAPPNRRIDGCTARPVVPVRRHSSGAGVEPSPAPERPAQIQDDGAAAAGGSRSISVAATR